MRHHHQRNFKNLFLNIDIPGSLKICLKIYRNFIKMLHQETSVLSDLKISPKNFLTAFIKLFLSFFETYLKILPLLFFLIFPVLVQGVLTILKKIIILSKYIRSPFPCIFLFSDISERNIANLTPSTSRGVEWGRSRFLFKGP